MFLQEKTVCLALYMIFIAIASVVALNVDFTVRSNKYFEGTSTKFEKLTKLGCCTLCGLEDGCLATDHNHETSECELITKHPNFIVSDVVSRQDWSLFTTADGCGGQWFPFDNSCYLLVDTAKDWSSADAYCKTLNAELVDIHSPEENAFGMNYVQANNIGGFWTGLNDIAVEGVFRWTSGSSLTFMAFVSGQPDNYLNSDCTAANNWVANLWDDISCHFQLTFICEKSAN